MTILGLFIKKTLLQELILDLQYIPLKIQNIFFLYCKFLKENKDDNQENLFQPHNTPELFKDIVRTNTSVVSKFKFIEKII